MGGDARAALLDAGRRLLLRSPRDAQLALVDAARDADVGPATASALAELDRGHFADTLGHFLASEALIDWLVTNVGGNEARRLAAWVGGLGRASDADLYPRMPRHALQAWAEAHDVATWLSIPARALPSARTSLVSAYRHTIGSVIASAGSHEPIADAVAEEAIATLQAQADDVRQALAEERRRGTRPDATGLLALRDELRAHALPRRLTDRSRAEASVSGAPAVFRYREQMVAWCGGGKTAPAVEVRLDSGMPSVSCDCARPAPGGCRLRLAAVDRCLDALSDADDPFHQPLSSALERTPWERSLSALDTVVAGLAQVELPWDLSRQSFGWRLRRRKKEGLLLEPVAVETRGRRVGLTLVPWQSLAPVADRLPLPADRRVWWLLNAQDSRGSLAPTFGLSRVHRAFEALVGHPHVYLAGRDGGSRVDVVDSTLGLGIRPGDDGALTLSIEDSAGGVVLSAAHAEARVRRDARHGRILLVDDASRICTLATVPAALPKLIEWMLSRGDVLPSDALIPLAQRLNALTSVMPVALDPGFVSERRAGNVTPTLTLWLSGDDPATPRLHAELRVKPGTGLLQFRPGVGPQELYDVTDRIVVVERAHMRERAAAEAILSHLGLAPTDAYSWQLDGVEPVLALVSAVADLASSGAELSVAWGSPRRATLRRPAADRMRLQATGAGLAGWLGDEGRVPLEQLLGAVSDGRRFVRLEGDDWLEIPAALQAALHALAPLSADGVLPAHPGVAQAFVAAGASSDEAFAKLAEQARHAVPHAEAPKALAATLRPYQAAGFSWLLARASWSTGACLADDMGLGKTLQAIALVAARGGTTLVLSPSSVTFNWEREVSRFFPTARCYRAASATELRHALTAMATAEGDPSGGEDPASSQLLITSYGLAVRHLAALDAGLPLKTVVLDEAHVLKNVSTKRYRAVAELVTRARKHHGAFVLALTGTPVENRAMELFSLYSLISPGLLGDQPGFERRFARPIERGDDANARAALAMLVKPLMLRRTKGEVLTDLPDRIDSWVEVDLDPRSADVYRAVRAAALTSVDDASGGAIAVLAALTRLRLVAIDASLDPLGSDIEPGASPKLERLAETLVTLCERGHRALVFSQFTRVLDRVEGRLEDEGLTTVRLDGSTAMAARSDRVDRFQRGEADVFLVSLRAGGVGLNLTAADYVIHLDPWWNPAVEDQATDRAHRIGQTRPVNVLRFVARGTIEEKIFELHERKRALAAELLNGEVSDAVGIEMLRAWLRS